MNSWKNFGKQMLKIILYFLIFNLLLTILYHFDLINGKICNYLRFIVFLLLLYFSSSGLNKKSSTKNIINGLLLGGTIIILFLLISLIFGYSLSFRTIIYYLLILGVAVLGSGRKKKKQKY